MQAVQDSIQFAQTNSGLKRELTVEFVAMLGYTPLEMLGDEHVCKVGPVAEWTEASDVLGADVNESQAAWAEK